jgi:hypothetical protein
LRLLLSFVFLLIVMTPASAHAIRAGVSVTETQVVVLVSFDGEDDLRGDVFVRLEDEQHRELGKVKINLHNIAAFPRPADGVYFVVAEDDGFGHRTEKRFVIQSGELVQTPPPDNTVNTINIVRGVAGILFVSVLAYMLLRKRDKADHGP